MRASVLAFADAEEEPRTQRKAKIIDQIGVTLPVRCRDPLPEGDGDQPIRVRVRVRVRVRTRRGWRLT